MSSAHAHQARPGMLANGSRSFSHQSSSSASAMAYNHNSSHGNSDAGGEGSLYSLCARVPLIKSPAVRVPPAVTLPPSLHPLPPNLHDYFVYPFSLEKLVLDAADRRERSRKEDMQRRAPGWSGGANDVLEPVRRARPQSLAADATAGDEQPQQLPPQSAAQNDIDEMARMLDELGRKS